jgi:ribosome maturation factor RimP
VKWLTELKGNPYNGYGKRDRRKASPFFDEYGWNMEKTTLTSDPLFGRFAPVLEANGLRIVEIHQAIHGTAVNLDVYVINNGKETDSKDCDEAYRLIYPLAQLDAGPLRDVFLTVSTPGLLRTLKDPYEFTLFAGRGVRIYDSGRKANLDGQIGAFDGENLTLEHCRMENSKEEMGDVVIALPQIQKAKLEYVWEDAKDGN